MRLRRMTLFNKPTHLGEITKIDSPAGTGRKAVGEPLLVRSQSSVIGETKVRILMLAVAGVLGLATAATAYAVPPSSNERPAGTGGPALGIVQVWGGCGWGWHPVPGHWSQWRVGWVPPHCAPNRYGDQGPYRGGGGPYYGGGGAPGGWYSPYGGGGYHGGGWSNP